MILTQNEGQGEQQKDTLTQIQIAKDHFFSRFMHHSILSYQTQLK